MSDLIKDTASTNNNPYGDIDELMKKQKSLLEQQQQQQNDIINKQTQMQIDEINREKEDVDKETAKTNSGLYTEYKKAVNPYGANAEALYTQGLGNSGYAESTQTSLYNTYQKNITDTINNANKIKSDFDFQLQQAKQNRDLAQAEYALEIYKQKLNLITQEYDLKNNKEQDLYNRGIDERNYNYQVERDKVSDDQWLKEYERMLKEAENQEKWNQKNYDYQVERDKITDSQWEKEYALQKQAKASSRSSSTKNVINPYNSEIDNENSNTKKTSIIGTVKNKFVDTFLEAQLASGNMELDEAYEYLKKHS